MFSKNVVIEASRKFVCVRIDSYESEANQSIVRSYLDGRFANTAFCILAPDGETRLTRSGRGPSRQFSSPEAFAEKLNEIASDYVAKGKSDLSPLPDFDRFGLALNVASADEKVLIVVAVQEGQMERVEKRLRPLLWDKNVQGRFHVDLETGSDWKKPLALEADAEDGIYFVKPGKFGLDGEVISNVKLGAPADVILAQMVSANQAYKDSSTRKDYRDHVLEGKRKGITIEMAVAFGEDRDGDGEIDQGPGMRRQQR